MLSLEFLRHLNSIAKDFTQYFTRLIEDRRRCPQSDLISQLVEINEQGEKLSDGELLGFCASLFSAGEETTLDLIGNGTLALLEHPKELKKLRLDPTIIPEAIEEILRFESPVQFFTRIAKEDVEIGGRTIRTGDRVLCGLGPANRDPEKFSTPHTLDLHRKNIEHVAFGGGPHLCIGASLARVEGQIAISTLFSRFPDLRLEGSDLERRENPGFRGLKSLPVAWAIEGKP